MMMHHPAMMMHHVNHPSSGRGSGLPPHKPLSKKDKIIIGSVIGGGVLLILMIMFGPSVVRTIKAKRD